MNSATFLNDILRPTLIAMDMHSLAAEKLLLMTACHESGGFRTRVQDAGGPARSYYQIEPKTLEDLNNNWLTYRPKRRELLQRFTPEDTNSYEEALLDDVFATACARMIYFRVPQNLPAADDDQAMAHFWKTFWNTHLGAGTEEKFLNDWHRYRPENYP